MSDLETVRELARAGLASLEAHRRRIDDLNVYPVPDGDTGTNLTLTCRSVVDELARAEDGDRATLARRVTRAALLGARGNSGVIFSQIVRGAADSLGAVEGAADVDTLARAFRSASDTAYNAVREPVEGTILSAIRALAEEAERAPDDFWPSLVRAGDAAVARTPDQLRVLREAGVVDAGAAGLLEIVRGIAASLTGEEIPSAVDDVPLLEGRSVTVDGRRIAVFRLPEGWAAIDAACPHRGGPLGDGLVAEHCVTCPLHGRRFDLRSGVREGGDERIATYPVREREGLLELQVDTGEPLAEAA